MTLRLQDIIDIEQFQMLQDRLNEIYSFPSAIIDNDGNILTATAWQDICTKFHRVNPESEKECIKSDQYIIEHLHEANPAVSYQCPHGLVDNATPIIIDGTHYGNFFTGQFLLNPPDMDFFKRQARKFGFDEEAYLNAVRKVPVWSKEQLNSYLFFIKGMIEVISGIGMKRLKEIEISEQLRESEQRADAIIRQMHDGFWIVDAQGRIFNPNAAMVEQTGYSREELLKMSVANLEAFIAPEEVTERIRQVILNGSSQFETSFRRKDGRIIDLDVSVAYMPDRKLCYAFHRDITERKRAEKRLARLNECLIELGANNEENIQRLTALCGEELCAASAIYNRLESGMLCATGQWNTPPDFKAIDKADGHICNEVIRRAEKDVFLINDVPGSIYALTDSNVVKYGVKSYLGHPVFCMGKAVGSICAMFTINNAPTDDDKRFIGIIAAAIGKEEERRHAENQLLESNKLLTNLACLVPGVIYQYKLNPDGSSAFPYSSPGMNEIYEFSPEEVREDATPVFSRLHPDDLDRVSESIFESARTLNTFYCEFRVILPRQGLRWRWSQAHPERTPDGGTLWHGIISDITDRKLAEDELKLYRENLEYLVKKRTAELRNAQDKLIAAERLAVLGKFSGAVAHEIRNPLAGIGTSAYLLRQNLADGNYENNLTHVLDIENEVRKCASIIDSIARMAKNEPPKETTVDLNKLVQETFAENAVYFPGEKRIDLPNHTILIQADEEHLRIALKNIIKNALQAMPDGGALTVALSEHAGASAKFARIIVSDTGSGISKEALAHIFEPLFSTKVHGMGFGLPIVKMIAERHGGSVHVESQENSGTTVAIELPLR